MRFLFDYLLYFNYTFKKFLYNYVVVLILLKMIKLYNNVILLISLIQADMRIVTSLPSPIIWLLRMLLMMLFVPMK